jgi:hypothetical protein
MGLYVWDGHVVGSSIAAHFHMGLTPETVLDESAMGEEVLRASEEQGGALAVLLASGGRVEVEPTLRLKGFGGIRGEDRRASKYFTRRFDPEFPTALKMILLLIEGEANTSRLLFPLTEHGHEDAVFRARTVSLFHSLTALLEIRERFGPSFGKRIQPLRDLLENAATRRLLTREGRLIRNRCMHYEIPDKNLDLDPSLKMSGIVEALAPGKTKRDFDTDVQAVTASVAELLAGWSS